MITDAPLHRHCFSLCASWLMVCCKAVVCRWVQAARQGESTRLQAQAFEAINEVVRCASPDTLPMVGQLIPLMINKLNETLGAPANTPEALERQSEIQARMFCLRVSGACVTACAVRLGCGHTSRPPAVWHHGNLPPEAMC